MPDTPSVILVKKFTYRDEPEEWSNKYHFTGFTPNSDADWIATINLFLNNEKTVCNTGTTFVRAYGYNAGSDHANYVKDFTVPGPPASGTYTPAAGEHPMAGDQAAVVRWTTPDYNKRGKRIYCWKYLHGGGVLNSDVDELAGQYQANLLAYANKLIDGTLGSGIRYCGPQQAGLSTPYISKYVTTRTLKRRGKRPPLAQP